MTDEGHKGRFLRTLLEQKWLILATIAVSILIATATTMVMLVLNFTEEALLIDGYLDSLPQIIQENSESIAEKYTDFSEDFKSRGDIASILYDLYDTSDDERLVELKEAVDALDVTLTDDAGHVVATTRDEDSSNLTPIHMQAITVSEDTLIDFNNLTPEEKEKLTEAVGEEVVTMDDASWDDIDSDEADMDDATSYIDKISYPMVYRARLSDGRTLIIELDDSTLLEVEAEQAMVSSILKRMLAGLEGFACILDETSGDVSGYPVDAYDEKDWAKLEKDVEDAFNHKGIFSSWTTLKRPSLKDRASLIRLAKVVGADYLMLFDKSDN